jgi:flavin reductase (DIM6/NTAB) family NADH-FMN oxidoreductase RutF
MTIEKRAFRDAMGCFATGICIASTIDADGKPVGVTVNSFTSVSLNPPLVLFCIDKRAESAPVFLAASSFSLAVLAADQQDLSTRFAVADQASRWVGVESNTWESGAPVLESGLAAMDCALHAVHDGGDHHILVGRVLRLSSRAGAPLLYFRGAYASLAGA